MNRNLNEKLIEKNIRFSKGFFIYNIEENEWIYHLSLELNNFLIFFYENDLLPKLDNLVVLLENIQFILNNWTIYKGILLEYFSEIIFDKVIKHFSTIKTLQNKIFFYFAELFKLHKIKYFNVFSNNIPPTITELINSQYESQKEFINFLSRTISYKKDFDVFFIVIRTIDNTLQITRQFDIFKHTLLDCILYKNFNIEIFIQQDWLNFLESNL